MIQMIYEHYGIKPLEITDVCEFNGFLHRNVLYIVIEVPYLDQEELTEIHQMGQFLLMQGERKVAVFMPNKSGQIITEEKGKRIVLCRVPHQTQVRFFAYGKELAAFHQKGRNIPYKIERSSRIGQWKSLWEKRLDQMERFWNAKIHDHLNSEMDKKFIESFPYYVGLAENAIQYLVDTEVDDLPRPFDTATICHHRFTQETWKAPQFLKIPVDWVFDHPSRDLAEYIRALYLESYELEKPVLHEFLSDYESITPLSSFGWRLLYARLLFPVHYFEIIEGYYSSQHEEKKEIHFSQLKTTLERTDKYEQFLASFYQVVGISTKKHSIPEIEWLMN